MNNWLPIRYLFYFIMQSNHGARGISSSTIEDAKSNWFVASTIKSIENSERMGLAYV